jgi:hypothetical protein
MNRTEQPIAARRVFEVKRNNCQSEDIVSHAVAQWSNEAQEWQLANTFGQPATATAITVRAALCGCRSIKPRSTAPACDCSSHSANTRPALGRIHGPQTRDGENAN